MYELIKMFYKSGVPKESWQYMFKHMDKNGDGKVSMQEFADVMNGMC